MKSICVIALLIVSTSLVAQVNDTIPPSVPSLQRRNLRYYFSRDTSEYFKAIKFDFQLDFRNSFVRDFPVDIYGGNVGVILHRKFRIGAGYYFFAQRFSNEPLGLRPTNGLPYTNSQGVPIPISKLTSRQPYIAADQNLEVNYACVNFTYRFFHSRIIDLFLPLEVGYGKFTEKLIDPSGSDFSSLPKAPTATKGHFVPGQAGIMMITKVHPWIHILSAIGYRKTLDQQFETQNDFTNFESEFESYYYRLGLQIHIGTIWKSVKRKR